MANQPPQNLSQTFASLFAGPQYAGGPQTYAANSSRPRLQVSLGHDDIGSLSRAISDAENLRRVSIFKYEHVEEPTSWDPNIESIVMEANGIMSTDYLELEGGIKGYFQEIASTFVDDNAPVLELSQFLQHPDGSPATFTRQTDQLNTSMLASAVFRAIKAQFEARVRQIETDYRTRLSQTNTVRKNRRLPGIQKHDLNHAINVELRTALKTLRSQLLSEYLGLLRAAQLSFVTNIVCKNCQRHHFDLSSLQQWEMLKSAWSVSNADVGEDFGAVEVYANPVMVAKSKRDLESLMKDYVSAVSGTNCRPADAGKGYYLL